MSKVLPVELNQIKLQITQQLEAKDLLVLNKTEDHYFDNLFLRQFAANDRAIKVWPMEINKSITN